MSTGERHDGEALTARVLGALNDEEVRAVDEHAASCEPCGTELGELPALARALGGVPPEAFLDGPPEGGDLLLQRTLRQVRAERAGARRRRRAARPPVAAPAPGPVRTASGADPSTGARLTVRLTPATAAWVRLRARVGGIPAGEHCLLVVVARDGARQIAGSWVVAPAGEGRGVSLDGSAAVAPDEVAAVVVETADGTAYVSAKP
ncbi:zf-HC2 domain-containing protein [Actinacidiphila glaucinigra]|uniref:RNA polymerase sigma-70 factor, ECF subfamily n=1 Tax=Actinacidiphila glaucinigra TaxID=235986 RepID=A0A239H4H8_9ACTN|nr:zf-HC2 domain-containing protein [Actinacidiphila glaucinigra]SNS76356.1 RNA polymerase sigma-70 factor, ECF subfamily [Actinacidiphila glaucinigra]